MQWRNAFFSGARLTGVSVCLVLAVPALAASDPEIDALRAELAFVKDEYEARISALEARLNALDVNNADQPTHADSYDTGAPLVPSSSSVASGSGTIVGRESNPAIGVIFQGQAWHSRRDAEEAGIPGFPAGGEAGSPPEGLAIGETEINMSANVDDLFTAWLTTPIVIEDGEAAIEIEEAWIETLRLPAGLAARFGRFFSGIGYLNNKHSHTWDFADQPLAYEAFLGSQYTDDGVQIRWLAPTDLFIELGAELLRGDRYPAGGAANGGVGSQSLFAHIGGDVGYSHSWQAGLSYLHAEARERPSGSEDDPLLFTGDSDLVVADFVWKWAPNGNWRQRNLVVQGEYLWRNESGTYRLPDGSEPFIDRDQRGWYAQAVYQPFPQWRLGGRIEGLSSDHPGPDFLETQLEPATDNPERYSLMIDWSHSEFSRLRLQYSRDLSGESSNDLWGLQYIHSIGAHGAHAF